MLHKDVQIKKSEVEGTGVFATKFIPQGTVVWKLDPDEKKFTKDELITLSKEKQKLAYQAGDKFIIVTDGSEVMNHSCNPNLWWEGDDSLSIRRDIQAGEELTYDYSTSDVNPDSMPNMECNCKSSNCRKVITYKDILNSQLQKQYFGHLPSWVLEFIKDSGLRPE